MCGMECPNEEAEGGYFPDPTNPCSSAYCECVFGDPLMFVSKEQLECQARNNNEFISIYANLSSSIFKGRETIFLIINWVLKYFSCFYEDVDDIAFIVVGGYE